MSILDTTFPLPAVDIVGIYDRDFNQLFSSARPIKATVKRSAKLMEHPLETGAVVTDYKITEPTEIDLSLLIAANDYLNTYEQINIAFLSSQVMTVQTRAGSFINMIIERMPHEEDPAQYDMLALALSLKEVRFVTAQYGKLPPAKVAKKSQASTPDKGEVKPAAPSASVAFKGLQSYSSFAKAHF